MKKRILTSMLVAMFAMPALSANIPNDATCNSGVLGVSSGSANLEADYTANTINITWDGNGGSTPTGGATSCTYDSTFNLPAAPSRTGYTFAGWSVAVAQCNLDSLILGRDMTYSENGFVAPEELNATWRTGDLIDETGDNYGFATGLSKCSSTEASEGTIGYPSDTRGGNCWCQLKSYTSVDGVSCNFNYTSWIREAWGDTQNYNESECISACASYCAEMFRNDPTYYSGLN